MRTVYFDTNAYVDAFEDRKPGLFPRIKQKVDSGAMITIGSDSLLLEVMNGLTTAPNLELGLTRFFSLDPKWLFVAALGARDVILTFDPIVQTDPVGALFTWQQVLPIFFQEPLLLLVNPDLHIPTVAALKSLFSAPRLDNSEQRRDAHLQNQRHGLMKRLETESKEQLFTWLVTRWLNGHPRSKTFADELLANPDRAPAFRLDFELECYLAKPRNLITLKNEHLDRVHAAVIPFVDFFITGDAALRKALEWYDSTVRLPVGRKPYMAKVCKDWSDVEDRLSEAS